MLPSVFTPQSEREELAIEFANIALQAGELIMASRKFADTVNFKTDGSPVTAADMQAEQLIQARLARLLPEVPIIAEESSGLSELALCNRFLLVDPIDGTREFVAGGDEFTVNIALVEAGEPVIGAIFAPALGQLYLGGAKAFCGQMQPGEI